MQLPRGGDLKKGISRRGFLGIGATALGALLAESQFSVSEAGSCPGVQTTYTNLFRQAGYGDQCTAYAEDKVHDATGLWMKVSGNAGQWANQARAANWPVGPFPEVNSVLVMQYASGYRYWVYDGHMYQTSISSLGHVAWVEGTDGPWCWVSDQNWSKAGQISRRWIWTGGAPVSFIYTSCELV